MALRRNHSARSKAWHQAFHSMDFTSWVAGLACSVFGCRNRPCHSAHIVGSGRTWRDVIPLCAYHHDQLDGRAKIPGEDYTTTEKTRDRFARVYHLVLRSTANLIAGRWEKKLEERNGST